jgi:putative ABC transport system permease protein
MLLLETRTLDEKIAEDLFPRRAIAWIVASCGSAGLLLAAVGLYGVISFTVARRRRDFGIRATLGARPRDLITLVLRDGLRLAAMGVPPGLLLGALGLRLTTHLAGPIQGFDWGSLVAAALVICIVIFLACLLPARRAAGADAMRALRES